MTGQNFDMAMGGQYSLTLAVLVILTFLIIFAKRWLSEEGVAFNWIFAAIGTGLAYLITISLTCSYKLTFVIGLATMIVVGFGAGYFTDGGEY